MTKRNEVSETLKEIADFFRDCRANESFNSDAENRYWRMQIHVIALRDLLREQEPVEPVLDIDTWKCRNCGHDLEHQEMLGDNVLFHEQYNYCPNCGRAMKWE